MFSIKSRLRNSFFSNAQFNPRFLSCSCLNTLYTFKCPLPGLPVNVEAATRLYEQAAEAGNENATHSLERLQAEDLSAEWKRKSVHQHVVRHLRVLMNYSGSDINICDE